MQLMDVQDRGIEQDVGLRVPWGPKLATVNDVQ